MKRHCLFVDDDSEFESVIERLPEIAKKSKGIELTYDFFVIDEKYHDNNQDIDLEKIEQNFNVNIATQKYDLVACDYDLGDDKVFGTDLIKAFRQKDRKFIAAIYSGNLSNIVTQILKDHNPKDLKSTLTKVQGLVTSNITRFFEKDKNLMEDITPLVFDIPAEKHIESVLLNYKNMSLSHGFGSFKDSPLSEIANHVRRETIEGKKFVEEILERGITHFIDLNK